MAYYRFSSNHAGTNTANQETHPEYDLAIEEWEMIRDVIQGAKFVKERGKRYLPALFDQEEADYDRYRARAVFFNATRRTRDGLVGLIMRKTPEVEMDAHLEKLQGDIDLAGSTINDYIREVAEDMTSMGRAGTFIDWSEDEKRPYFSYYHAEDILSWEKKRQGGKMHLTRLVLRECGYEHTSEAGTKSHAFVATIRTYTRDENGVVICRTEIVRDGMRTDAPEGEVELRRRGKALGAIPFVFHTLDGDKPEVTIAPLADMATINVSHYQSSADLENGRHICGIPTVFATGFDSGTKLILGTSHAWVSEQTDARAGFVEFTGQGLQALENALKEKQEQMAVLGARMLEPKSGDAESFETVQLRSNSEQATLVNISEAISATMSRALQWAALWLAPATTDLDKIAETTSIVLNTDFVAARLDGAILTALVAAHQTGAISWPTFFYQLQQGEFYPQDWKIEEEESALLQQPVKSPMDPEKGNESPAGPPKVPPAPAPEPKPGEKKPA
jgi:hypothetical protein